MEKFAYDMEELLQEKLSCYRQLSAVMDKEKAAIAAIDLDALWQCNAEKKALTLKITALREKLLENIETELPGLAMDTSTFSIGFLIKNLPVQAKTKSTLRKVKLAINSERELLAQQAKFNRTQVRKYLSVVDDIMSVVGDNSSQAQYTGMGTVSGYKKQSCMFKAEV
jgi:hypothetical protein